MGIASVQIGTKRVYLTSYCPDDALGLAACDYVLLKLQALLDGTPFEEMRDFLVKYKPEYAEMFSLLEEGYELPWRDDLPVDPSNIGPERRIVEYLIQERMEQAKCQPSRM